MGTVKYQELQSYLGKYCYLEFGVVISRKKENENFIYFSKLDYTKVIKLHICQLGKADSPPRNSYDYVVGQTGNTLIHSASYNLQSV